MIFPQLKPVYNYLSRKIHELSDSRSFRNNFCSLIKARKDEILTKHKFENDNILARS